MKRVETSPVVEADAEFFGKYPHLCIDVRFRTKRDLDRLIQALTQLRDSRGEGPGHVHLQHARLSTDNPLGAPEVVFHRPGKKRDWADKAAVARARAAVRDLAETEGPIGPRRRRPPRIA